MKIPTWPKKLEASKQLTRFDLVGSIITILNQVLNSFALHISKLIATLVAFLIALPLYMH